MTLVLFFFQGNRGINGSPGRQGPRGRMVSVNMCSILSPFTCKSRLGFDWH